MNTSTPARSFDLSAVLDGIRDGVHAAEQQLLQHFLPQLNILLRRNCDVERAELQRRLAQLTADLLQRIRDQQFGDSRTFAHDLRALLSQYYVLPTDGDAHVAVIAPASSSPEIQTESPRHAIAQALRQLPNAQAREMVMRFYLQHETSAQICASLKIQPAVLRQVLADLRQRFREALSLRATSPRFH